MTTYQQCTKCVLDTQDDPEIAFDQAGICNYCAYFDQLSRSLPLKHAENKKGELTQLVKDIQDAGKGKPYDCIIGVSGGVDSTYTAYFVKQLGLRPLAVHLDYGWNSEVAVRNIESILKALKVDLHTHVLDWEEVKDIQLALLKASVVDLELVNDFAINCLLYNTAYDHRIKYILHGGNVATEGGQLPKGWTWHKYDQLNLFSIHKKYGTRPLRNFPSLSFLKRLFLILVYRLQFVGILNYTDYRKEDAEEFISKQFGWQGYGGKHYESVFTRFYQGYILPKKFGIDKRKFFVSVLVCSGQMTKSQALVELEKDHYPETLREEDRQYVLKKLGLSEEEFKRLMDLPVKQHSDYPSYVTRHYVYYKTISEMAQPFISLIKKLGA